MTPLAAKAVSPPVVPRSPNPPARLLASGRKDCATTMSEKPQRELPEYIIELLAAGRCIGESLAHRPCEGRCADAERIGVGARTIGRPAEIVRKILTFGDSIGQECHRDISSLVVPAWRDRAAKS